MKASDRSSRSLPDTANGCRSWSRTTIANGSVACARRCSGFASRQLVEHVDLDPLLCPDDDCDALRNADGIHVDPEFAPLVLDELLDGVLALTPSGVTDA